MENTLLTLAEIHYDLGLISHDEYCERLDIALWLSGQHDMLDPRQEPSKTQPLTESSPMFQGVSRYLQLAKDNPTKVLVLGMWVFSKPCVDTSYPSVPCGYYKNPNRQWPKLDPYTGRIFNAKHQENPQLRVSKSDLQKIWSDDTFISFCRETIIWYQEQFRSYTFPVRNHLRAPKCRV